MVTWNSNIPQPGDLISNSQAEILNNNQAINSIFNDATNGDFTKFLVQAMGTIPAVVDPVSAYHTVAGTGTTFSGKPLPYFKNSLGEFPLMPDLQVSGNNYSFQIGNLIIKFGKTTSVANNTTVTFVQAFPNNCFAVLVSGGNATGTQPTINVNTASVSTALFVYKASATADAAFWLAIGN